MQNNNTQNWDAFKQGDDKAALLMSVAVNKITPAPIPQFNQIKKNVFEFILVDEMEDNEPEFLIEDFLESENSGMIFGEPACGKSFFAIDMACCIATGRSFHGKEVMQGAVFYIAGEGHKGLKRRFSAWAEHNHCPLTNQPLFTSKAAGNFMDKRSVQLIEQSITALAERHGTPKLIIIDTLARNFGSGDENIQKDMSQFIQHIDELRTGYPSASTLIVHHTGHGEKNRGRGSSALKGALDAEYQVMRYGDKITVKNTKMKDSDTPPPMHFEFISIELGITKRGKPYGSAVLVPTDKPAKAEKGLTTNQSLAIKALDAVLEKMDDSHEGVCEQEWWAEFSALHESDIPASKRTAFNRAKKELIESGDIIERDGHFSKAKST